MTNTATLRTLLKRVESAARPCRIIDAELDAALRVGTPKMERWTWTNFPEWRASHSGMVEVVHSDGSGGMTSNSQPFTASLDASILLAERMLPATEFILYGGGAVLPTAVLRGDENHRAHGATLPLAVIAVTLCVLIHQNRREAA